jgi:2,5-diketo-D-gluconate reductase B
MPGAATDRRLLEVRGTVVPRLGFGTWQLTGRGCRDAVRGALDLGYRHIDTARAYGNERDVGSALADSGVAREDVFLTTKVWMDDVEPRRLRASAEASLRDLATPYVDLLLIHWPNPAIPLRESLDAMQALRDEGKIRELGVSNFPPRMLKRALDVAPVFCDQVEHHPFLDQAQLLDLAVRHDLLLTAYSPLGHGAVLTDPVLREIGAAHGKTAAQVALRWLVDRPHVAVVPKAASHRNRVANMEIWDFELTDAERAAIDALPKDRREMDPGWAPDWES